MQQEPYFLKTDWWYYDVFDRMYKLKDGAPKEVVDSYNEFYAQSDVVSDDGAEK